MHDLVTIAIIAGVLALDDRAGWQSLLGEPVFSGTLVGLATGHAAAGMSVGVVLQLVWLSIGAARGSRRPNVVVGGVVGAGVMCIGFPKAPDPVQLGASAVFLGLLAGEAGAWTASVSGKWRERWLEGFKLPPDTLAASRNLAVYTAGSALLVGLVDALVVLSVLPLALPLAGLMMDGMGGAVGGAGIWLAALPGLALAVIAHAFATRSLARFVLLGAGLLMVVSWLV